MVLDLGGSGALASGFTNTLWEYGGVYLNGPGSSTADLRHNLFRNAGFQVASGSTSSVSARDNLFDTLQVSDSFSTISNSHNAFFQTNSSALSGALSSTNLTSLAYEPGPLGRYYLPTTSPLIGLGSRNATNAGLFHFTTTTNQMKETTSQVDIGLHYVALTNNWTACVDTDGDTLADYVEDKNGNGTGETNSSPFETHWLTSDSDGDVISDGWEIAHGLNPFVNDAAEDADDDGYSNYQEYLAGRNPRDNWIWSWGTSTFQPHPLIPPGIGVSAISVGFGHTLAVNDDGRVVTTGNNSYGQTNVPASLSNVVAVAAGDEHSLALRSDGSVVAWGRNDLGECDVPANATNVKAISAGGHQSLALKNDGTVVQWGKTFDTSIPAALTSVAAIVSGTNFHLALKSNGTVVAWGENAYGQTNTTSLADVTAIAAGGAHGLALRTNGTVVAWGANSLGQSSVPSNLTNIMAIAAGYAHSLVLSNNGTVFAWGDNTYGQTTNPPVGDVRLIAAGGNQSLAAIRSDLASYPVDVTKDLLLIYNANSIDSSNVCAYYLAHRPLVSQANVLGIDCFTNEIVTPTHYTNQIAAPILNWLNTNPTKRPLYVVLFLDMPSRVNTNTSFNGWDTNIAFPDVSVSVRINSLINGWRPLVTHINMNGTNDCRGYIDKLQAFGAAYSPGKLVLGAREQGYRNTNFVLDGVRWGAGNPDGNYSAFPLVVSNAVPGLLQNGTPSAAIIFLDGIEINGVSQPHLTNVANVAGYMCWGSHSSLGAAYATNGFLQWNGDSRWWIIETVESLNGIRGSGQGNLTRWFSANAFGGLAYSNVPVGAVTHVEEPLLSGINDPKTYFGLWSRGKRFSSIAWRSRQTPYFQAVGDPLVTK